jgi:hypothetical protein
MSPLPSRGPSISAQAPISTIAITSTARMRNHTSHAQVASCRFFVYLEIVLMYQRTGNDIADAILQLFVHHSASPASHGG